MLFLAFGIYSQCIAVPLLETGSKGDWKGLMLSTYTPFTSAGSTEGLFSALII